MSLFLLFCLYLSAEGPESFSGFDGGDLSVCPWRAQGGLCGPTACLSVCRNGADFFAQDFVRSCS